MAGKTDKIAASLKELAKLMVLEEQLTAKVQPITEKIAQIREELLNKYTADELDSVTAAGLRVGRTMTTVPSVTDLDKFLAFATKKANWDLLGASVQTKAWRLRMDTGKVVPGIEPFNRVALRVTKVATKKK